MDKVTVWERESPHLGAIPHWTFNHIVQGWVIDSKPTPLTDRQATYWYNCKWRKFYAYETDNGEIIHTL